MSAGLMGDAEAIKFVFGKDTAEKIAARIDLMERAKNLPAQTKVELIRVLYGLSNEDIRREMNNYIAENFPQYADQPASKQFAVWWQAVVARERKDLAIIVARLQEGG